MLTTRACLALSLLVLPLHGLRAAEPPAGKDAAVVRVILVRHAEAGAEGADPELTPAGRARAQCLAAELRAEKVTHVFTSPWQRTRQTLAPLAGGLSLDPMERDPMAASELAAEILSLPAGSCAVVAGHSNTLPLLAKAFGAVLTGLVEERGQPAVPRTEHDRIVTMRVRAGSKPGEGLLEMEERRYSCAAP